MICARNGHAVATDGDRYIYAMGGQTKSREERILSVERYDVGTDKWAALPPLKEHRTMIKAVDYGGRILVAGGVQTSGLSRRKTVDSMNEVDGQRGIQVETFDPRIGKWEIGPSMNVARANFGLCNFNDNLFAVVGDERKTVEVFEPRMNHWSLLPVTLPPNVDWSVFLPGDVSIQ